MITGSLLTLGQGAGCSRVLDNTRFLKISNTAEKFACLHARESRSNGVMKSLSVANSISEHY